MTSRRATLSSTRSNHPTHSDSINSSNRTGKRPVWAQLTCTVCGFTEAARPKKWWPAFTYLTCDWHSADELSGAADGMYRSEVDGIGSRFVGIVDEKP